MSGGEGRFTLTARYAEQRERETCAARRERPVQRAESTGSDLCGGLHGGRERRGELHVPEETGAEGGASRERPARWAARKERPARRAARTERDQRGGRISSAYRERPARRAARHGRDRRGRLCVPGETGAKGSAEGEPGAEGRECREKPRVVLQRKSSGEHNS